MSRDFARSTGLAIWPLYRSGKGYVLSGLFRDAQANRDAGSQGSCYRFLWRVFHGFFVGDCFVLFLVFVNYARRFVSSVAIIHRRGRSVEVLVGSSSVDRAR